MVSTSNDACVSFLLLDDRKGSVPTNIMECFQVAVLLPDNEEVISSHLVLYIVPSLGEAGFVRDLEPFLPEYGTPLELVHGHGVVP